MMEDEYSNPPPDHYGNREPMASSREPDADNAEYISRDKQKQFGTQSDDQYGAQDQFGDVDDQDPYSNLYDQELGDTPGGEGLQDPEDVLYGAAEPPVEPAGPHENGDFGEAGRASGSNDTAGTGDGRWG